MKIKVENFELNISLHKKKIMCTFLFVWLLKDQIIKMQITY